ncbi:hypothetical protein CGLAU_02055 [Corynebacterium glaucum]|uniref:Uncharacterized protein n=1 Tax=Corynebacterium glaucum TaxID=187491 RepID=A0A1Q2HU68_9CORY|nr:DUF2786 domain-containing protein [Corynebacterium glaucum]AQQ14396.1 hypothetical protein CGLAU_02055 [Corynebacterium glaucum]
MRDIDKIKEKVQKLLNQASDRQGTPEGDSFYAKAFDLMATYGFDQRDLAAPDDGDEVIHKTYRFAGAYTDMQSRLLFAIARALHCTGFFQGVRNSTRVEEATVFGLRRHMERVDMLYSLLAPVMITGARRLRADSWADSTVVIRRSFMTGFAATIEHRLSQAEETIAQGDQGYALALIDDSLAADLARDAFVHEAGLYLNSRQQHRSLDADAYFRGRDAGDMTDLGQTRVNARPALPL